MKNLSIENITRACKGTFHGDESILNQEVSGVVIDSRKVDLVTYSLPLTENVSTHTNSSRTL